MWLQLNKNFSLKLAVNIFSAISTFNVYIFQLSWVSSFPWLHCDSVSALPKQSKGPTVDGHTKIVTEHFQWLWGLKWERIAPKSFESRKKAMTGWYDFSNVKSSKMLSFYSVAEAPGLIYPRPFGRKIQFCLLFDWSHGKFRKVRKSNMWGKNAQWALRFSFMDT